MKVYYKKINSHSFCLTKILNAFKKYSPSDIEYTNNYENCDLVLLNINGRLNQFEKFIEKVKKPYVVMQYCIRGTRNKKTSQWRAMWENAEMVWSYYPLDKYIQEERGTWSIPNFCHSPLGADESLFTMDGGECKKYIIFNSGLDYNDAECYNEIYKATLATNKMFFHLGRISNPSPVVINKYDISDSELASYFRLCCSVSGLRRVEGFEVPVVEGLFCGIRPICFDRHHYRIWYDKWAKFIPEDNNVVNNLVRIFNEGIAPITKEEREEAVEIFSWKKIIKEFWSKL